MISAELSSRRHSVDQHAQWLRAANQIATQASARNAIKSADKRKFRKQQQRKVLYWKKSKETESEYATAISAACF